MHLQILRWQHKRQHHRQEAPDAPTPAELAAAAAPQRHEYGAMHSSAARGNHQAQQEDQQQQQEFQHKQHMQELQTADSGASSNSRRPQLVLTLNSVDQQPAALAVLQALYGVKPVPELLSGLSQKQQLQVALLADMWQVLQLTSTAVSRLYSHLQTHKNLTQEVTQQLLDLQAVPDFLHLSACCSATSELCRLSGAMLQRQGLCSRHLYQSCSVGMAE